MSQEGIRVHEDNPPKKRILSFGVRRRRVSVECPPEEAMTEQAHKQECDINFVLREYQRTGYMRHAKEFEGRYDDVTGIEFQKAMDVVANAKSMFEALPSSVRQRFGQDPVQFLNYVQNPRNKEEMREFGILIGNDGRNAAGEFVGSPKPDEGKPAEPKEPPADPPKAE